MWRAVGLTYVRYSEIASTIVRKCMKVTAKEAGHTKAATLSVTRWDGGKQVKSQMSTSNNRMSINFDAALPKSIYDEETWLVEPPTEANSSSSSGHVIEWLQEATLNVDYETRTALARKLAKQAAKKKKKAEKLFEKSSDFDEKNSYLSEIKEGVQEEESENLRDEKNFPVEVARSENSRNDSRERNPAFSQEKNVEDLMMSCSVSSGTSSDEEFFDVPEYPSLQSSSLTEQKAVEKVRPLSHDLASVKECVEDAKSSRKQDSFDEAYISVIILLHVFILLLQPDLAYDSPRLSESSEAFETTPVRQTNTARVPPTVFVDKKLRLSSPGMVSDLKRNSPPVIKSHSLASADLVDIQRKAKQQELALREECNLWKPSSQSDCSSTAVRLRTISSTHQDMMKGSLSLSSSRSADFLDTSHSNTVSAVSAGRTSRLPTPVRRPAVNARSSGIIGRSHFSNTSTLRQHYGDAAASLPGRHSTDTQSECGRPSFSRKPWADGCF